MTVQKFTLKRESQSANNGFVNALINQCPEMKYELQSRNPGLISMYQNIAEGKGAQYASEQQAAGNHTVASLIASGGAMLPTDGSRFFIEATKSGALLPFCDTITMARPNDNMAFVGMGHRVLLPNTGEYAVPAGTTASDFRRVNLNVKFFRGKAVVSRTFLEDNIEQEGFVNVLLGRISQAVANDIELDAIQADTAGAAATITNGLAVNTMDGFLKRVTSAPIAAGGNVLHGNLILQAFDSLGDQYLGLNHHLVMHPKTWNRYVDHLMSVGYDTWQMIKEVKGVKVIPGFDYPVILTPFMPVDQVLITDPQNLTMGVWREVDLEMNYEPSIEAWEFYPSIRYDVNLKDAAAARKITGLGVTPVATP